MKKGKGEETKAPDKPVKLNEGEDFYFEDGLMVLSAQFLLRRGYCCENSCRHCPYGFKRESADYSKNSSSSL